MRFRFSLQMLLDERVREEEQAYAVFARAQAEYQEAVRVLREADAVSAACDPSAFVTLDGLERARILRVRGVEEKADAQERARGAFARTRSARMQLTVVRERAYGAFLQEEERKETAERDEANAATSSRLRVLA